MQIVMTLMALTLVNTKDLVTERDFEKDYSQNQVSTYKKKHISERNTFKLSLGVFPTR